MKKLIVFILATVLVSCWLQETSNKVVKQQKNYLTRNKLCYVTNEIKPNEDYTIDIVFEGEETRILDCKDIKDKIALEEFMNAYLEEGIVFNEKYDICPDYCYLESKIKE